MFNVVISEICDTVSIVPVSFILLREGNCFKERKTGTLIEFQGNIFVLCIIIIDKNVNRI